MVREGCRGLCRSESKRVKRGMEVDLRNGVQEINASSEPRSSPRTKLESLGEK